MAGWVAGVVGTFVVSLILASWLLRQRCRRIGPPFGPRARPWALLIVVTTAIASTCVGLLLVAASRHLPAAYIGVVVPGGLWFSKLPPRRDLEMQPWTRAALLTLPFSRLYARMGEDMTAWCETRCEAASVEPQWIADAATYYFDQVRGSLKDRDTRGRLAYWVECITHQIAIVRLINLDTTPARLRDRLQEHRCTQNLAAHADGDLPWLADRLESDALSELNLFLSCIYQRGYHKMLVYPFRLSAHRDMARRAEPTVPDTGNG